VTRALTPTTFEQVAAAMADAAGAGQSVKLVGGGTKRDWGSAARVADLEIRTSALDRIVEHNEGDLTAVLEAGVPLARAQRRFASAGQMLALDPFLGPHHEATIGGILAAGDSGPLRHRYGAPRDLVLGVTVALSDGTIARAGGKVIKNVAGYDLGKLFCGSLGTLGAILSVNLRLHPLPARTATALGVSDDPDTLAAAALTLARAPLELEALDVAWRGGRGGLLAQSAGAEPGRRARRVAELMRSEGLDQVDVMTEDEQLWARQRAGQRSQSGALVRVCARPSRLVELLAAVDSCSGTLVGRAALGWSYVELEPELATVARFRRALAGDAVSVVVDAPAALRTGLDPWGSVDEDSLELMRRVKQQFDPAGACNPGLFVGGL
jgi:glycolate oxidase FAD binding subunit